MNLEEFNRLVQEGKPMVVDFWAPWCGPCRSIKPILNELARQYQDQVMFLEVNADDSPEVVEANGIYAIPTVLLYQNGREVDRYVGAQSREAYRALFESLVHGTTPAPAALRPFDRVLRLTAGGLSLVLGWTTGNGLLIVLGAAVIFSGIYDRCPIWQAIRAWWNSRSQPNAP